MRPNRDGKQVPPGDGGYDVEVGEVTGSPVYHVLVPPAKSRGPLIPLGTGEGLAPRLAEGEFLQRKRSRTQLVPTVDEVASLPRLARNAFILRCEQRVPPGSVDPTRVISTSVAHYLFVTATIDTPLTAQLRCIRRDFNRLKRLAREQKWTDDTPVPPDVFGPLWPRGVEPHWAVEAPKT